MGKGACVVLAGREVSGRRGWVNFSFMLSSLFCRFAGIGGASCCNMMRFLMENRNLLREKLGLCDLDIGLRLCVILLCPYRLRPKFSNWSSRMAQFFQKIQIGLYNQRKFTASYPAFHHLFLYLRCVFTRLLPNF